MASMKDLIEAERPARYTHVIGAHLPWVVLSGGALAATWLLPMIPVSLPRCLALRLTGLPCPFCGLTRSMSALAAGDLGGALYNYPLSIALFFGLAGIFAWHACGLLMGRRIRAGAPLRWPKSYVRRISLVAVLALAANWFYRLYLGLQ